MPIEFDCQGCQQRLSTPAGSAGQQCQCPGCGSLLIIPESNTAENQTAEVLPAETGSLNIPCPRCRYVLQCAASLLGTKGQCRNCQHIFTIAEQAASDLTNSALDTPTLVFHCPHCRQLFAGQAEMEGRKGKCHACGEVFTIALEPGPSKETQPSPSPGSASASDSATSARSSGSSSGSAVVASLAPKPAEVPQHGAAATVAKRTAAAAPSRPIVHVVASSSEPAAPIQFSCQHCAGTMEVPASAAGQQTNCPYCGVMLTIPPTSQAAVLQSARSTSGSPHSSPHASSPAPQQAQHMWAELGDMSGAVDANPYAASSLPHSAAAASPWSTRPRRKRRRGLTFTNAFELTLDSLFPFCLVAPLLFGMAAITTIISYLILIAVARSTVRMLELADSSVWILGVGVLLGTMIISSFLFTATYCMTCNTALHAVRGKRVSARVVFGTGDAYGGMLAIMLGWAVFNFVRKSGVGFLMSELSNSGDPQTAQLVGALLTILLTLAQITLTFLWGFVAYALLDGQSLSNAMSTSVSLCLNHLWTVLAVIICGWILYLLVSIVTVGLGLVVLMAFSFYMNAAMYHLAED